jgi:hypothetical protein
MAQHRKDNYEPPSREKWLEYQFHEFQCAEDKADVDRMARKQGAVFLAEFREHKEKLRKGGMSIEIAWQTAIREFAPRVPTRDELKKNGTFAKYERNRRSSKRQSDANKLRVDNAMTRRDLHEALAGKKGSVPPIEWVAENLFDEIDILGLDPADIPSRTALNMLEWAKNDRARFWKEHADHEARKAAGRISLSDSGRNHEEVMRELCAQFDVFEAMMETADAVVGA